MQLQKIIIPIVLLSVFAQACIKQVDVATRNEKPILVVEGDVSTDSVPYTVKLTYSGPITYSDAIPDQYLEKDAVVTISDDNGHTTPLSYTTQGVYQTTDPSIIGKVGTSYSVTVLLKDGRRYISKPEKIKTALPISAIDVSFVNKFDFNLPTYMNIAIDTKDPAGEENYYRWTYQAWILRQTHGVGCGFGCVIFEYCYQHYVENDLHILSDADVNGNDIKNQTVGRAYIYTFGNPYLEIGQVSLTREAYQFWKAYQDQQTRTGGILDPLPAAIKGNVYNAANANDFALGYFSASAITHKKVILVPYSITQYLLDISATQFIPEKFIACFDYYPNSLVYPPPPARQRPPPPGWENAEQLNVYW